MKQAGSYILILFISFALIGCDNAKEFSLASKSVSNGDDDDRNRTNDDNDTTNDDDTAFIESCDSLEQNQPKEQITKKVDIIIVTDTSGSLNQERATVADGIDQFINGLGADVDYRIGVMLAHAVSNHAGNLYKTSNSEALFADSEKLNTDQVRNLIKRKLTQVVGEGVTDGGEAGLYSLNRSLEQNRYDQIQSQGFYRADAALAVIFISDENAICATYPNGVTPVRDGDNKEIPAYDQFCKNKVNQMVVYNNLKNRLGARPLVVSSIIYTDPNRVPAGGENEVGYGFLEIAKLNKGKLIDMRDDNIALGLKDLGELTQTRLNLLTEFKIQDSGTIKKDSIKVYVDGISVTFDYNELTRSIQIDENLAGESESLVKIDYCSLKPKSQ